MERHPGTILLFRVVATDVPHTFSGMAFTCPVSHYAPTAASLTCAAAVGRSRRRSSRNRN
eukprot:CAMPEP_0179237666 /NCGR_PEP_ID=MMETSP0797-20121207/14555_1 /TAXON_ID=47934 /ORGANISM="Dinophysis acuminata, Strain DAEP01" /LENGTH=59 /DNA_ID=CAMNT_0020944949 /DNA_START=232 /DNA_END=408 /DNA_ORIENTATION=-